jgi:RNA polymerase sigma-70 factor (ECF subfamily)
VHTKTDAQVHRAGGVVTNQADRTRAPLAEEEQTIIAAAQRDPRAFAPLYEAYADLVWRYAMARLGDRERALDATSQTFAQAIIALPRFRWPPGNAPGAFRAWLMTIARHVVLDALRSHRPMASLDERFPAIDIRYLPEAMAIEAESARRAIEAIAALPPVPQRIVRLRLIGLTSQEIAEIVGLRRGAVDTAYFRAIRQVRAALGDEFG